MVGFGAEIGKPANKPEVPPKPPPVARKSGSDVNRPLSKSVSNYAVVSRPQRLKRSDANSPGMRHLRARSSASRAIRCNLLPGLLHHRLPHGPREPSCDRPPTALAHRRLDRVRLQRLVASLCGHARLRARRPHDLRSPSHRPCRRSSHRPAALPPSGPGSVRSPKRSGPASPAACSAWP